MKRLTTLFFCLLLASCSSKTNDPANFKLRSAEVEESKAIAETSTSSPRVPSTGHSTAAPVPAPTGGPATAEPMPPPAEAPAAGSSKVDSKGTKIWLDKLAALNSNLEQSRTQNEAPRDGILTNLDEAEAMQMVQKVVDDYKSDASLNTLSYYESHVTKKMLLPLSSPSAVKYLRKLELSNLHLTDDDIEPLKNLRLVSLTLSRSELRNLHALKNMTTLKSLDLKAASLGPAVYQQLSALPNLEYLDLSDTALNDQQLKLLSKLKHLKNLDLGGCQISYAALKGFIAATHNKCYINSIGIQDQVPSLIFKMDYLMKDKKYAEVAREVGKHLKAWKDKNPPDYDAVAASYLMLGRCESHLGRKHDALIAFTHFYESFLRNHPSKEPLWGQADGLETYVRFLQTSGEWEKAFPLRLGREKLASSELSDVQSLGRFWQLGRAQNVAGIGECYAHFGQLDKALQNYKIAIPGIETFSDAKDRDLLWPYIGVAKVYKEKNDLTNCKKYCTKARQMLELKEITEKRRDEINSIIEQLEK